MDAKQQQTTTKTQNVKFVSHAAVERRPHVHFTASIACTDKEEQEEAMFKAQHVLLDVTRSIYH